MAKHQPINRNYGGKEEDKVEAQNKLDKLMEKFLAKGGKIEKLPPGAAQGAGGLDRIPHWTDAELKAKWEKENGIKPKAKTKKRRSKK